MPVAKKWYESKTMLLNLFMGLAMIITVFFPNLGAVEFVNTHFGAAGLGLGWSILNVVLRLITKTEISA